VIDTTLEIRMSSKAYGMAQGHYLQLDDDAIIADLHEHRKKYAREYGYKPEDVVFELWKDWELLLKNEDKPSLQALTKHTPGYYGDDRLQIDIDDIPASTKLHSIFDFVEVPYYGDIKGQLGTGLPFKIVDKVIHFDGKASD
jgi:hypothetical protein